MGKGRAKTFFASKLLISSISTNSFPSKEALNFNITVSAIFLMLLILTIITFGIGALLTFPIMLVVGIAALVFTIIAAVKANEGIDYRYPVSVRIIK